MNEYIHRLMTNMQHNASDHINNYQKHQNKTPFKIY